MSEKKINSRVILKHDIEENWLKSSFIPLQGEIIIYDKDSNYNYERMKIGDGETNVNDLPFVDKENIKYADVSLQQWYDDGIMYAENGSNLNIDGLNVSCAPNNDNLIINYTGYIRIKDNMYDAGNSLIVDGVNYPGVYEGEVKSSISLWGTVGVWTFEYVQIDRLDTFASFSYVNEKITESTNEINTRIDTETEALDTKISAVNDRVDDILYEDISLQELLDNGQLTGIDWSGQTVTPSVYDLTVSGIDTLTINYNGYIEFKVNYGGTPNGAVTIDGVAIEPLNDEETEFKGNVNSYISIYCTVMSATFEYIRTSKKSDSNGDMLKSVYDADNDGIVDSAEKLATARTISLSGAVDETPVTFDGSQDVNIVVNGVKEAYLQWGGKDIPGNVTPLDSISLPELSGNRLAFLRPQDIQVEYSRDGGITWLDYGMSDENKVKLVTTEGVARVGNATSGVTPDYQVRITLTAAADYLYFTPIKALIRISSNGAQDCWVTTEYAYIGSETNFVVHKTKIPIRGWSGWNSIVMSKAFGGTETQTSNVRKWRFTFGLTSLHSNTSYANNLAVMRLYMIGASVHKSSNNMAGSGHLYSYDWQQNATFPANVDAANLLVNGVNIADTYATQEVVNQLLARIEALEAQVSEANAILETI